MNPIEIEKDIRALEATGVAMKGNPVIQSSRSRCCNEPCITRIGDSNGKAFVIYLRDGTKITIGRDSITKGPAWLEVKKQSVIIPVAAQ